MPKQQKFITSHRSRVAKANEAMQRSPEIITIIDREALVEFYLLEDVFRLYEYRLRIEQSKKPTTRAGIMTQERVISKFKAILQILASAIEVAWGQISSGNYKIVWKSIHEHSLMVLASNLKFLPELRELLCEMLRDLSDDAMVAGQESNVLDESLDDIENHEANVRLLRGIPAKAEIDEIIKYAEAIIPNEKSKRNPFPRIN